MLIEMQMEHHLMYSHVLYVVIILSGMMLLNHLREKLYQPDHERKFPKPQKNSEECIIFLINDLFCKSWLF